MEELSSCGLYDCRNCPYRRQGTCPGCQQGNLFLETWGRTPCGIYACVRSREIDDCRSCASDVCALRDNVETVCPLRAGSEEKIHWTWRIAHYLEAKGAPCHTHPSVPSRTLMRLRWYMAALQACQGMDVISSRELADRVGVGSAMVRKDFSYFGEMGTPGLGYHVADLKERIRAILDEHTCRLAWVGAQWLGNMLTTFAPTLELNFRIVAAFDTRPEWIGKTVGAWEVQPLSELPALLSTGQVDGAVLAQPEGAELVAEALIDAGVRGILNLTPVALNPPLHVNVRHVDLIGEMMALAMEVSDARDVDAVDRPGHGHGRGSGKRRLKVVNDCPVF